MSSGSRSTVLFAALITIGCTGGGSTSGDGGGGAGGGAPSGPPIAEVTQTTLAFGNVGCAESATKEIVVKNTGTGVLIFSHNLVGSGNFVVTNAARTTVSPGASGKVTVVATVPGSASAGVDQTATLTLTTNDPNHPKFDIGLSLKSAGVTLTLAPAVASFGILPLGVNAPAVPLTLTNTGNLAANVTFTQPGDPQFSLNWQIKPSPVLVEPGASVGLLTAGFRPTKSSPSSTFAAIAVVEAKCANSISTIPMTGQGTNGVVGFSTTDVFFGTNGKVNCGTTAAVQTFTLSNTGNQAFAWNGTLSKGAASPFTFSPTSGTVPANTGVVTITVTAKPIPATASTAPDAFGDTLSIVTDVANDLSHQVRLHQTANGAALVFAPSSVGFGNVPINTSTVSPMSVVNEGSAAATVTLTSDNAKFSLVPSGAAQVQPNSFLPVTATFAPGTSVLPETGNVTLAVGTTDVLCAPLPTAAALSGTGSNGAVGYSPVALDFGNVNCGTMAAPKTVTFINNGNQSYAVTPSLGRGLNSPFVISMSNDAGVVPQDGGTLVITAAPKPIPQTTVVTPNQYGDTLTVTTDVVGDLPHDIPLRQTARGAIFALSSTALSFGSVPVGGSSSIQFTLTNNGNAPGALNFTAGQPLTFSTPQNASVNGASSVGITGTFTPQSATAYQDTAVVSAAMGTVLCAPLPLTMMQLTGTGTAGNVVVVSTSSLTFGTGGLQNCGTVAPAKTFTVTNNSAATLNLSFPLAKGAMSPYTISGPSTVATAATVTITVTPKAVPATSSTVPDGLADSLALTAVGGITNETHTVVLHQTAQGAVLTFSPTGLNLKAPLTGSRTEPFNVINAGNVAAPYTLSVGGTNAASFSVTPGAATANPTSSVASSATLSAPLSGGTGTRTAAATLATPAVLCAPVPAPLVLNGTIQ